MFANLLKIIGILVTLYLISAFIAKSNYKVERKSIINAPQKLVYNQVGILRNWDSWSPWVERDPSVQNTYEGKDGEKASIMKWVGDKDLTGTGQIEITEVDPPNGLNYKLTFKVPFEMSSKGTFLLSAVDPGKTNITWSDEGDIPFLMRPMMMFMDMDKQIGPDFERGLVKLDSITAGMHLQILLMMAQDSSKQNTILN
ncbi:MAG: SRPBCC family protein [Saprospiraceae bacterium]|nr:SRPBCC family protein [Saprospiraceae bacterium]